MCIGVSWSAQTLSWTRPALTKKYLDLLLLYCKAALGSWSHIQEHNRRTDFVRIFRQQVSTLGHLPSSVLPHHALLVLVALGSKSRALGAFLLWESSQH